MRKGLIPFLRNGGIAVMQTAPVYGIVASALSRRGGARLLAPGGGAGKRKPFIILIPRLTSLREFSVPLTRKNKIFLAKVWPGPVSVILPCASGRFAYLRRGTKTLAFRLPKPLWLRTLLARTGPLVAPSANPEGKPPARTIGEARAYFKENVSWYEAGKRGSGHPSALVSLVGREPVVLRKGKTNILK